MCVSITLANFKNEHAQVQTQRDVEPTMEIARAFFIHSTTEYPYFFKARN